jgi:hypothetical protein
LTLFAAAWAFERQTKLWRVMVPALLVWAFCVPAWLGGRMELLPHAVAALLAWAVSRLLPEARTARSEDTSEPPPGIGLGLNS